MILCKYSKLDSAVFMPHMDVLRTVTMAIRRTGLHIRYSEGFHQHEALLFSSPLSLGLSSQCEYFCADSDEEAMRFQNTLNRSLPKGLRIEGAAYVEKNPNIAAIITFAEYTFAFGAQYPTVEQIRHLEPADFRIDYTDKKGSVVQKDKSTAAHAIRINGSVLTAVLDCGKNYLRADKFNEIICKKYGISSEDTEICKAHCYCGLPGALKNIDDLFQICPS